MKHVTKATAITLLSTLTIQAQEITEMEPGRAEKAAQLLSEAAGKLTKTIVKVQPDIAKAAGLRLRKDGILVVPQKDLTEESKSDDATKTPTGAGFAYLFFSSNFQLVTDGKPVPHEKVHRLKIAPRQDEIEVSCVMLSARQINEDEWQMHVYGPDKKALTKSAFEDVKSDEDGDKQTIALSIKREQGTRGKLVVTLWGKYSASVEVQYTP